MKIDPKTGKKLWRSSKNREKQVEKVANLHNHTKNQRKNFNHNDSRNLVNDNYLNIFENLNIQKMMQDRKYARGIADSGWYQLQRFTKYKAEWAGNMVDFVDPRYTSQNCSRCGKLVGRIVDGRDIFKCSSCGLEINVHQNAAINIRNRSEIYQEMLNNIYQRLTKDLKEKVKISEERLRLSISPEAYCWSRDKNRKILNRDAIARIYAFGEVTSTHMETYEQATSWNKEAMLEEGEDVSKRLRYKPRPLGVDSQYSM